MGKINFDVYLKGKRLPADEAGRNFFGHYAKTVRFGQKWYSATVP